MSTYKRFPQASSHYNQANSKAITALREMQTAMREMSAEHVNFHKYFDGVQIQLQEMKKAYGSKELDPEVIRSTALDKFLSEGNLPKVTALGHFAVENALKNFQLQKKMLDEIRKQTGELVESLLGD
ncbi:hypothetical protein HO173_004955 [Letharia columbiana]|uniref:Uncharacterized protein n=1 Tax=Letharia columbiana TaxID=112416 RepID=A0A8H6L5V9_9LECA|nr:uncharacterized protein HO173_004955 [Letharia columbiana]KAF6236664.1 hypothetical protein HO173_004955 [Letharia columbiana]